MITCNRTLDCPQHGDGDCDEDTTTGEVRQPTRSTIYVAYYLHQADDELYMPMALGAAETLDEINEIVKSAVGAFVKRKFGDLRVGDTHNATPEGRFFIHNVPIGNAFKKDKE